MPQASKHAFSALIASMHDVPVRRQKQFVSCDTIVSKGMLVLSMGTGAYTTELYSAWTEDLIQILMCSTTFEQTGQNAASDSVLLCRKTHVMHAH